jgi:hypothetical protein
VVTRNKPIAPVVKNTFDGEVIAGTWSTVTVNVFAAAGVTPLEATSVIGYAPPDPAEGAPAITPVPLPLSVKKSPAGRVPDTFSVGGG